MLHERPHLSLHHRVPLLTDSKMEACQPRFSLEALEGNAVLHPATGLLTDDPESHKKIKNTVRGSGSSTDISWGRCSCDRRLRLRVTNDDGHQQTGNDIFLTGVEADGVASIGEAGPRASPGSRVLGVAKAARGIETDAL